MKTTLENTVSKYDQQAETFLTSNGLKFRATLSDTKTPQWAEGEKHGHHYRVTISRERPDRLRECSKCGPVVNWTCPKCVTPTHQIPMPSRLVFDFWGSIADADKLKVAVPRLQNLQLQRQNVDQWSKNTFDLNFGEEMKARERAVAECHPSAYDVLACISSDVYCPETFAEFCADYGYEADSIKALQTFRRCSAFAKRLRAFFTAEELSQLSEIQ